MIKKWGRLTYQRFLRIRGTPKQIGLGLALGLFIGFSPSMGVQIIIAVSIASLLKWSKIAAALGVQVTNPLTAPFIYSFTYFLGARLMGLENEMGLPPALDFDFLVSMIDNAPGILAAMAIGGLVVGLPAAAAGYLAAYILMDRYQEKLKSGIQIRARMIRQKLDRRRHAKLRKDRPRR